MYTIHMCIICVINTRKRNIYILAYFKKEKNRDSKQRSMGEKNVKD